MILMQVQQLFGPRTNIYDANDNYESKLSISMKDVPNDADVVFKVAKRGPVSDIAIIDASNNNESFHLISHLIFMDGKITRIQFTK